MQPSWSISPACPAYDSHLPTGVPSVGKYPPLKGLQKTTLIDYPGMIACTVFLGGCNFRCGYCYNSDLVLRSLHLPTLSPEDFFSFLTKRKTYLEGVCITGGEPTLYGASLVTFCQKIKELGFLIKLDTNGTNTALLKELLAQDLIDYIAMDIKASLDRYEQVAGVAVDTHALQESISIIMHTTTYEFRTTVVPDVINAEVIHGIGKLINGAKQHFIQQFRPDGKTIDPRYQQLQPLSLETLKTFQTILQGYVTNVGIRA
ncbi:anaerobic ribonucleoside-triphosphate reductase activating protein [Candidatus Woesearchaeota archaeon]|nr:anaerobic ribonucleoside-triphosphate reductase activating protein [Candidatus Woesearchaeota archaeon]